MAPDGIIVASARRICISILVVAVAAGYVGWVEWKNGREVPLFIYLERLLDIDDAFQDGREGGWQAWTEPVGDPVMISTGRVMFTSDAKAIPLGETHAGPFPWCKAIGYESKLHNQDGSPRAYPLQFDQYNCGGPHPPAVYVDYKDPKNLLRGRYFILSPATVTRIMSLDPRSVATLLPGGKLQHRVVGDVVSEKYWLRDQSEETYFREIVDSLAAIPVSSQSWQPFRARPNSIRSLIRAAALHKTGVVREMGKAGLKKAFRDVLGSAPADANIFGFRVAAEALVSGMPLVLLALSAGLWHRLRRVSSAAAINEPWLLISPVGFIEKVLAIFWKVSLVASGVLVWWAAMIYQVTDFWPARVVILGCLVVATLFTVASVLHIWSLNSTLKTRPVVTGFLRRRRTDAEGSTDDPCP